jgi:hypothetical protein
MQLFRLASGFALSSALLAAGAAPLRAQNGSMRISLHSPDSVAHIIDRAPLNRARFSIVNRDGTAALLLMDTTIVAQMTDRGLAQMSARSATDTISGVMERMIARMALGALRPLFDHGIAYHLRDLGDARYADGKLLLLRKNGDEVFKGTEIGHGPLMESFAPSDAKEFAKRAREARTKLRS